MTSLRDVTFFSECFIQSVSIPNLDKHLTRNNFHIVIVTFAMSTTDNAFPATQADELVGYPSPNLKSDDDGAGAADVPAVTKDEVLESGTVAVDPKTPEKKTKKKKAAEEPPGAPKKRKPKKKALVSASPSVESGPRYYYDIQNFIVSSASELARLGFAGLPEVTSNGISQRVSAPATDASATLATKVDIKKEIQDQDALPCYMYPSGVPMQALCTFCVDCGMRIAKHAVRTGSKQGERARFYVCPDNHI